MDTEDTESEKQMHNEAERESELANDSSGAKNRTMREIFDRSKSVALDCAEELSEMIPDLELDGLFGDDDATDDKRPMPTLVLAKQLCAALENIECIKVIMEKEQYE
jgi:hypothetical protein